MENSERLAVVETKLEQISVTINSMNDKLDVWNQSYVPRAEIDLKFDARDKKIEQIDKKLEAEEHNKWSIRKLWPAWLGVALSAGAWLEKIF
ncbi:hypothetical protein [Oceanobacillus damuensis]|uniref:hypothetical protein n=1 Tax=Oceanobacillus damuensis TaxID=937928 RepID=UPI0012ED15A6|nr:hypothetical protein [Oceanobacillus damuensis]